MNELLTHDESIWPLFEAVQRQQVFNSFVTYGMFVSATLIALARYIRPSIFQTLLRVLTNNQVLEQIVRENYNTIRLTDFMLLVNFWLTCSMSSMLFLHQLNSLFIFHLAWPILIHVFFMAPLFGVSFISGSANFRRENSYNLFLFPQFVGLVLLPIIIVAHLNIPLIPVFTWLFFTVIGLLLLYLNWRGIIFAFQQGISLYYIILYICTLEILPIVAVYLTAVGARG